ncbi:MAG TPA: 2OG-Fe(II) oxygenase [Candidatus Competibacteraceae bacterium]|nr:2OG-Fe(II) oxygenase [Candidatus Competibacteraceae bacterium]
MSMLNLAAFEVTPLQQEPFEYLVVPGFVNPDALEQINRDFPPLQEPRSFFLEEVTGGPGFQTLIEELQSPAFRQQVEAKFGIDLAGRPIRINVWGYCGKANGNIHTDSKTKLITVLLYLNRDWPHEGGRLRVLRSATDLDDYAAEVPPMGGHLLVFRRSEKSFHGHKPFQGERRVIQFNWWVDSKRIDSYEDQQHNYAKRFRKMLKAARRYMTGHAG